MDVTPIEVPLFETVTVAGAVDIRRVAEWAGASVQDIQDLNPELRRWTTPIRATEYELKVPMGAAEVINTRLTEQGGDDLAPLSHYTVKKNETLLSIAKKLGVSRSDLAEANYLSTKSKLETGQQLIIPRAPTLLAARTETGVSLLTLSPRLRLGRWKRPTTTASTHDDDPSRRTRRNALLDRQALRHNRSSDQRAEQPAQQRDPCWAALDHRAPVYARDQLTRIAETAIKTRDRRCRSCDVQDVASLDPEETRMNP